jgi:hypothetical protein
VRKPRRADRGLLVADNAIRDGFVETSAGEACETGGAIPFVRRVQRWAGDDEDAGAKDVEMTRGNRAWTGARRPESRFDWRYRVFGSA